jgi:hypothetical protein
VLVAAYNISKPYHIDAPAHPEIALDGGNSTATDWRHAYLASAVCQAISAGVA